MNVLKRNTDYAIRIVACLGSKRDARGASGAGSAVVPAAVLAGEEDVSVQFAAKILQKLAKAGIVESVMGKEGGYRLVRGPEQISLNDIIEAVQGPISVNRCSPGVRCCPRQPNCGVSGVLCGIESDIKKKLSSVSLADLLC